MIPSWQIIRACNIVVITLCAALAITNGPNWITMADAFLAGICLGSVVYITMIVIPMRRAFDEMSIAFKAMCNDAIIASHKEADNAARIHPAEREDRTLH